MFTASCEGGVWETIVEDSARDSVSWNGQDCHIGLCGIRKSVPWNTRRLREVRRGNDELLKASYESVWN